MNSSQLSTPKPLARKSIRAPALNFQHKNPCRQVNFGLSKINTPSKKKFKLSCPKSPGFHRGMGSWISIPGNGYLWTAPQVHGATKMATPVHGASPTNAHKNLQDFLKNPQKFPFEFRPFQIMIRYI